MLFAPVMRPFRVWRGIIDARPLVPWLLARTSLMTGTAALCETSIFLSSTARSKYNT